MIKISSLHVRLLSTTLFLTIARKVIWVEKSETSAVIEIKPIPPVDKSVNSMFRDQAMKNIGQCLIAAGLLFIFGGCNMFADNTERREGLSEDANELQKIIKVNVPGKSIKWEIFDTPEDTGFAPPGPTEYTTLVAQVDGADSSWFARLKENPGRVWIAPESARVWLSPYFKELLVNSNADMRMRENCKKYQAAVTKSGRLVDGFACQHDGSLLIHVMLMSPTW